MLCEGLVVCEQVVIACVGEWGSWCDSGAAGESPGNELLLVLVSVS